MKATLRERLRISFLQKEVKDPVRQKNIETQNLSLRIGAMDAQRKGMRLLTK